MSQTPDPNEPSKPQEESAPEVWLEQHGNILFKFAMLRVRDPHIAEDLVQEVLVKAFAAHGKFRHESSVRSWLFQILRNEISGFYRKKKKEKTTTSESQFLEDPVELRELLRPQVTNKEFASAVERDEFWEMIQICFNKIPEHLLETFLYRLANPDEKIETLCEELDLNSSNFSVRLFRTRLMLRECVERSWLNK
ncbi:MAG: sigma-70 family RNA polymerase sigma factor [Mariniblastus sp.]